MTNSENKAYNPADDDNQGVIQLMAQGQDATPGVSQNDSINPVNAQGPEPEKAEVNEESTDLENSNEDLLTAEEVKDGEADLINE